MWTRWPPAPKKMGVRKALLTGIKYTMQSQFYQQGFAKKGMEMIVPNEADQDRINSIIFDELCINVLRDETRQEFRKIVEKHPCDAAVLGCTELPLLLKAKDTSRPLLDTTQIHCEAILNYALGHEA